MLSIIDSIEYAKTATIIPTTPQITAVFAFPSFSTSPAAVINSKPAITNMTKATAPKISQRAAFTTVMTDNQSEYVPGIAVDTALAATGKTNRNKADKIFFINISN